jgi:hypothetical protein
MKAVLLAVALFACEGDEAVANAQSAGAELIGEDVTVSYVADPAIGHGRFRLENHAPMAMTAAVKSAWLALGEHRRPLPEIRVFDLALEKTIDPSSLRVEAGGTIRFLLSFPSFAYEPGFGESVFVELQLSVDGSDLQARSPIRFVRRIPLHR